MHYTLILLSPSDSVPPSPHPWKSNCEEPTGNTCLGKCIDTQHNAYNAHALHNYVFTVVTASEGPAKPLHSTLDSMQARPTHNTQTREK